MDSLPNLIPALPELTLAVGLLILVLIGSFNVDRSADFVSGAAVALLIGAAGVLILLPAETETFGGSLIFDSFARFMKLFVVLSSAAAIVMSVSFAKAEKFYGFEYPILILLSTLGMMIMVSANDLISLYLGLELQSLAAYVIAAINRDSLRSSEAGLKYFVLGALSSGMLLYGASLVYGFTGSIEFTAIAQAVSGEGRSLGLVFGLVFLMAGLAFKVSAAPFHMWTPDVYEGAPTPVTTFLATASKAAAVALLVRVSIQAFPNITQDWRQIVIFLSIASMLLGAFAAIGQRNIKRLLAYSSISNIGFALMGLAAGSPEGVQGVLIYMAIYLAMTLGAFAFVLSLRRDGAFVEDISELSGFSRSRPLSAFLFAVIMFSLAGVPPAAGFFAKFYVFSAAIEQDLYALAVIGAVATVIGAYYYLRIVATMYFSDPRLPFTPAPWELGAVFGASSLFILGFVVYPGPLVAAAEAAARALF